VVIGFFVVAVKNRFVGNKEEKMKMSELQQKDYDLITDFWKFLRDFGDITTNTKDDSRWSDFMDRYEDLRHKYPEQKNNIRELIFYIQDRYIYL
jgi:hypothetical protein